MNHKIETEFERHEKKMEEMIAQKRAIREFKLANNLVAPTLKNPEKRSDLSKSPNRAPPSNGPRKSIIKPTLTTGLTESSIAKKIAQEKEKVAVVETVEKKPTLSTGLTQA